MNYIYGPVPSRRLGLSLGVSPIPKKRVIIMCLLSIRSYCHMTNTRNPFLMLMRSFRI
jgi:wyosine [tRNA(Phe)-imidazoG37] synthetase (radical SAM superfamily)